ncbi:MAG: amino acid permease [Nitrososphaerota archaeon]|nr:amino acid permease [Nitrososphaerota archaeon]MDG6929895.1 amino acid permease [Nitrososphaerota archaeon]
MSKGNSDGREEIREREAVAVGLGAIIGAGIFVLSGTAIALAGSFSIISFIIVGTLSLMLSFILAELSTLMPKDKGSVYSFVYRAFGPELGMITGLMFYFSFATSISAVSIGFGSYLASMFGLGGSYYLVIAMILIAALTALSLKGLGTAAKTDFWLVLVKLLILLIFIIFAVTIAFFQFKPGNFTSLPTQRGVYPIFASSISIFFAYSGFQTISSMTDRVKGGPITAARSIVKSVLISMAFYIMIIMALLLLMPVRYFTISADPLLSALNYAHAPLWFKALIDVGALFSTASAALAMIITTPRIIYQIFNDFNAGPLLTKYTQTRDVAPVAVLITVAIALAGLFAGNIYEIAAVSNFGDIFSFIMASFSLLYFGNHGLRGEYRTPAYPYLPVLSIIMLLALLLGMPRKALLINTTLIILFLMFSYAIKIGHNSR